MEVFDAMTLGGVTEYECLEREGKGAQSRALGDTNI